MSPKGVVPNAQASNEQFKPSNRPVGLFLGGTSGIGQAMAEQLAKQTNGRVQIVILGRSQEGADKIIASFPHTPAGTPSDEESKYSFIKVDATSMTQIRDVTSRLSKELDKVNFIVTSCGALSLKGREDTSEGIDRQLACYFYARFRFIYDLMPLVVKSEQKGERVGVMSVLGPIRGGPVDLEDMGLAKSFSLRRMIGHGTSYTDASFEELATRYPAVSFMHTYPGTVLTPMLTSITGSSLFIPLLRSIMITPEQCAHIMWWRMWTPDTKWKGGSHRLDNYGEDLGRSDFVTPEVKKAVWDHAIQITSGESKGTTPS